MSGDVTINAPAGDPSALMQLADQLDQHAGKVGDLGANTLKTTQGIQAGADWTGDAANKYGTFTGDVAHGVGSMESPLHNVANAIRGYAGVLQRAQKSVADAVTTANNAAKANDPNTQAHVTAAQSAASAAQDDVNKAGDSAAHEIEGEKSAFNEFLEKLKPYAEANDWAHMPLDFSASDLWLDKQLEAWAKSAGKGVDAAKAARTELDSTLQQAFDDQVGSVAHDFDNGAASMEDVTSAFAKYDQGAKAAIAGADGAVSSAETGLSIAKAAGAASKVMGGLAVVGDVYTILHPEETGAAGTVKQVAAGANIAGTATALLAVNASADWIPVAGEAVAAGTGLYLAGDALYHIPAVHDVVNKAAGAVANVAVGGAKDVAHAASSAWHAVTSLF
ncbi:MAG TPA: hypothetical protein VG317_18015 [Pseudonocardiaceae bacterium]|jgi:uncharacterized protein YukE|nr:hypothetical protein [Pseudonocardiaceae bacterium]